MTQPSAEVAMLKKGLDGLTLCECGHRGSRHNFTDGFCEDCRDADPNDRRYAHLFDYDAYLATPDESEPSAEVAHA